MYQAQDFTHLIGTPGMSESLLKNHFTLYEGYVKNTNTLIELKKTTEPGTPQFAELERRFGWEWNGMRLHELYFGNMKSGGSALSDGVLKAKIIEQYGSFDAFMKHFIGVGTMRGIGWVVLSYDKTKDALAVSWVNEHDVGHLVGTTPLLIMDVFEHAFMLDYGLKRADYINAFVAAIDWSVVEKRLG